LSKKIEFDLLLANLAFERGDALARNIKLRCRNIGHCFRDGAGRGNRQSLCLARPTDSASA
jgi:hypothetical protein